jgi:hypothetical protein
MKRKKRQWFSRLIIVMLLASVCTVFANTAEVSTVSAYRMSTAEQKAFKKKTYSLKKNEKALTKGLIHVKKNKVTYKNVTGYAPSDNCEFGGKVRTMKLAKNVKFYWFKEKVSVNEFRRISKKKFMKKLRQYGGYGTYPHTCTFVVKNHEVYRIYGQYVA